MWAGVLTAVIVGLSAYLAPISPLKDPLDAESGLMFEPVNVVVESFPKEEQFGVTSNQRRRLGDRVGESIIPADKPSAQEDWRLTPRPTVAASEAEGVPFVLATVAAGATVHADEANHWDALEAKFLTRRINHSEAYSLDGACTNMAESFFSRLRRAEIGTHHHIAGAYLSAYAAEMAWREDNRRVSNGEQFLLAGRAALEHPVSRKWKGYWQRA